MSRVGDEMLLILCDQLIFTMPYILPLQMASLYNKAVALHLEQLYNKTSDFGIDYEKGCQIFTDCDKYTFTM